MSILSYLLKRKKERKISLRTSYVINFVDKLHGTHIPGYIKPLLFNDREDEYLVRPSNPADDHEILDFVRIVTQSDPIAVTDFNAKLF